MTVGCFIGGFYHVSYVHDIVTARHPAAKRDRFNASAHLSRTETGISPDAADCVEQLDGDFNGGGNLFGVVVAHVYHALRGPGFFSPH